LTDGSATALPSPSCRELARASSSESTTLSGPVRWVMSNTLRTAWSDGLTIRNPMSFSARLRWQWTSAFSADESRKVTSVRSTTTRSASRGLPSIVRATSGEVAMSISPITTRTTASPILDDLS
jgi:hypothetical protein